jgi:hypothetical protein
MRSTLGEGEEGADLLRQAAGEDEGEDAGPPERAEEDHDCDKVGIRRTEHRIRDELGREQQHDGRHDGEEERDEDAQPQARARHDPPQARVGTVEPELRR